MLKRRLFLLLCSSFLFLCHSCKDDSGVIEFKDSNFEKEVRSILEKPKGKILQEDIDSIKDLTLIGVSDIEGISRFSNLESVSIDDSYCLESVDFSKSKNLEIILIRNTSVRFLSLPDESKLYSLMLFSNDDLVSVSLDRQIELTSLNIFNCGLSSVDLSMNKKLERITISSTSLKDLDISQNLLLEKLFISNNDLTSLDLTYNKNLEALDCSYNRLETLNLKSNLDLMFLNCSSNYIDELDISSNVKLNFLRNSFSEYFLRSSILSDPSNREYEVCKKMKDLVKRRNCSKIIITEGHRNVLGLEIESGVEFIEVPHDPPILFKRPLPGLHVY